VAGRAGVVSSALVNSVAGLAHLGSILGRDGPSAVRLHTDPGDSNVAGSLENERNDLTLSQAATEHRLDVELGDRIRFPQHRLRRESGELPGQRLACHRHLPGSPDRARFPDRLRRRGEPDAEELPDRPRREERLV
jgi:hypothetical protein